MRPVDFDDGTHGIRVVLYVRAHFTSDVIAGLLAGAAWIAICASAFEIIRRRSGQSRAA
jgi:membrane-associated phospholipid phosphatase